MTEDQIQISILAYLRTVLPTAVIWHVPNAPRSAQTGARLKRLGMRAGVPDLCVLLQGRLYLIEVKRPGQYASPEQRSFMEQARLSGAESAIVRSIEDVALALASWGIVTRAAA